MIVSLIVVGLVGIGFTRLALMALELRDDFEDRGEHHVENVSRKRREIHARMSEMAKPKQVVRKSDGGMPIFEAAAAYGDDGYGLDYVARRPRPP